LDQNGVGHLNSDRRWRRKAVWHGSPVDADSRRPSSVKKTTVEELSGPSVPNANGWKV